MPDMAATESLVMVLIEKVRRLEAAHDEVVILAEKLAVEFGVSAPPAINE
jgi:hypothetical protein